MNILLIKQTSLGDVGHAIQRHAERHGYSIVREYCGHGIGRLFHTGPNVLHYKNSEPNGVMAPGRAESHNAVPSRCAVEPACS